VVGGRVDGGERRRRDEPRVRTVAKQLDGRGADSRPGRCSVGRAGTGEIDAAGREDDAVRRVRRGRSLERGLEVRVEGQRRSHLADGADPERARDGRPVRLVAREQLPLAPERDAGSDGALERGAVRCRERFRDVAIVR
jgi:hypothetical protein